MTVFPDWNPPIDALDAVHVLLHESDDVAPVVTFAMKGMDRTPGFDGDLAISRESDEALKPKPVSYMQMSPQLPIPQGNRPPLSTHIHYLDPAIKIFGIIFFDEIFNIKQEGGDKNLWWKRVDGHGR